MDEKEVLLVKLGARVRELRDIKDLSQTELAHSIGKDQQSIQRLEAGKINPSYVYLLSIAKGLEISLAELIDFK